VAASHRSDSHAAPSHEQVTVRVETPVPQSLVHFDHDPVCQVQVAMQTQKQQQYKNNKHMNTRIQK
jgi:hypothetical protein